jgi:hypothetical protein
MPRTSTITNRDLKTASIDHVMSQIQWGFQPHWLLTYHYGNPYERGWRVIETSRRWGYRVPRDHSLWNVVNHDKSLTAKRNDPILVSRDAQHIRNLMLQHTWGIQGDLRAHDRATTPMLFVHEKGLQRLQYHTHIVIGELPEPWTTPQAIRKLWREQILQKHGVSHEPTASTLSRSTAREALRDISARRSKAQRSWWITRPPASPELIKDIATCQPELGSIRCEATSVIQAKALINQHQPTRHEPSTEQHDRSNTSHYLTHRATHRDCQPDMTWMTCQRSWPLKPPQRVPYA